MAIADINISETLEAGAPSIKYEGDMRTSNTQVASHQGNDAWLENRIEALMDMGLDWASAAQQAQKELREGDVGPQDLASGGRAHFGLGSLFKSIGKAAKKIVKSPLRKAAIIGGLGMYGMGAGPWASGGMWSGARGAGFLKGMGSSLFGKGAVGGGVMPWNRTGTMWAPGTKGILGKLGLTAGKGSMMPTALGFGTAAVAGGIGAGIF